MNDPDTNYRNYGDTCAEVYPPEEFEGLWVEHWGNGQLKFRGAFKPGLKRIGQHICFWETGALQEVSYWDEGWVCGTLIRFNEDGTKEYEKDYGEYGGRTRSWTEKSYGVVTGELMSVIVWKDDDVIAEWHEPESRRMYEEIGGKALAEEIVDHFMSDDLETTEDVMNAERTFRRKRSDKRG
jgi:hypothetical protein